MLLPKVDYPMEALKHSQFCYVAVWLWPYGCLGFPGGSDSKESAGNAGALGSVPRSGRSSGEGNGSLLQYCLENSILLERRTWWLQSMESQELDMTEATECTYIQLCMGFPALN